MASGAKRLIDEGKTTSLRGLYYMLKHTIDGTKEETFEDQADSDTIIEDMEVTLNALREEMHLYAQKRGEMVGPITLTDSAGVTYTGRLELTEWNDTNRESHDIVLIAENAEQANKAGGISVGGKKYKVEIVYADYQSNTPRAVQTTEQMITQNNVNFLFSPFGSGAAKAGSSVSEKYKVPTVKVTGGQRIDLLGIKKEDLPGIWADLNAAGMVSGHAYGKSIRTVKTCVGMEHCRFGTQLAMSMGVKLEKMLFDMYAPHKVKLAVSGCPRNCAEAGIKDVGIIGVDSGYEIYIAGNGGIKTEVAQFLCKVSSDEEVMEYSGAFLQLYREEGWYLERTCHYLERVGMDYVKGKIVEDEEGRKVLYARLLDALKDAKDPWATSREPEAIKQFEPISI